MLDPCPGDCNGNGKCVESKDGASKSCQCSEGFAGANCMECDPAVHCSNHGTCIFPTRFKPLCECYGGFSGVDCSFAACPVGATPGAKAMICSDKGDCVRDNTTGNYQCVCEIGFGTIDCHAICPRGLTAEGKVSDIVCSGHGYCADSSSYGEDGYGTGQCVCNDGFTGDDCSEPACSRSIPLEEADSFVKRACGGLGQGACVKGACYCRAGFAPPTCAKKECPNDCSGTGVCMEGGKCACDSGFGGDDCSEPACCDPKCNGHGECKTGRCHCEGKFFIFFFFNFPR
jgi:tenascin